MGFQADVRSGTLTVLASYASAQSLALQIYGGRPRTIAAPTAFCDRMRESIEYIGLTKKRTVQLDLVFVHGTFDSAAAAAAKDAFVDGFVEAVAAATFSAAGDNTTLAVVSSEDDPTWTPEWLLPNEQKTYFASLVTVEGFAGE